MEFSLDRVIMYVNDVDRLRDFYVEMFGLALVEEIPSEWVVLKAGACAIGLHRVGPAYHTADVPAKRETNVKLVLTLRGDLEPVRSLLMARGVPMGESYGTTGPLCYGTDSEGNVFQIAAAAGEQA